MRWVLGALILGAATSGSVWAEVPSADTVIQRAVARSSQAETRARPAGYTYTKISVTEQLDATGKVRDRKEKVYQVSCRSGMTSAQLLEVNGHPPGSADLKKQAETELSAHQMLGESKSASSPNRENFLTAEVVARFSFTMRGEQTVNGRKTYEIDFQPKTPPPPVHRLVDRLLNHISGTIWIDAEEFEIARTELHLGSEVDFLGGVVGCLKKLAYTMTRTRVAEGLWVKSSTTGDFEGRKLFDSMRIKTKSQVTNFHPLAEKG